MSDQKQVDHVKNANLMHLLLIATSCNNAYFIRQNNHYAITGDCRKYLLSSPLNIVSLLRDADDQKETNKRGGKKDSCAGSSF
ncbi:hypothetical protein J4410_04055 [Candidatus Woesearchaeota archaeon]|nr:hypothetical protein [Candidatus Woesearchaeota archaeon]